MSLNNHFNVSRFWKLLRLEVFRSRKGILMTLAITFGLHFFVGLLMSVAFEPNKITFEHGENYGFSLIIGGFVLSSLAFIDLGKSLRRGHFLTLPVSIVERFLCMWLLTTLGWVIMFTITFSLYTVIANAIGSALFTQVDFIPFDPLGTQSLSVVKYYVALQGVFLLGATHFKGFTFAKTLLVLIVLFMVSAIIGYLILSNMMVVDQEVCLTHSDIYDNTATHMFWKLLVGLFWWVLPPSLWVATYFGLKDQEV